MPRLPTGCGKTELCGLFREAGFGTLDEAFLDMPEYALHPQSLLMETSWVCAWFERVLKKASEGDTKNEIYIADRSPFSAVFYASKGHLLKEVIAAQLEEVRSHADIHIYTVYLQVEKERLWSRISERLLREPGRAKYNEDKREWMEKTLAFYDGFEWDMAIPNNEITMAELMYNVVRTLSTRSPLFQDAVLANEDMLSPSAVAAASPLTVGSPVAAFHEGGSLGHMRKPVAQGAGEEFSETDNPLASPTAVHSSASGSTTKRGLSTPVAVVPRSGTMDFSPASTVGESPVREAATAMA